MDYVAFDCDQGVAAEVYQTGQTDFRIVFKDTDCDGIVAVTNYKDKTFREIKKIAEDMVGFQN